MLVQPVVRPRQTFTLPPIQKSPDGRGAEGSEMSKTAFYQRQPMTHFYHFGPQNAKGEFRRRQGMCNGTYSGSLNKVTSVTQSGVRSERKVRNSLLQQAARTVVTGQNQRHPAKNVHRFDVREARDANKRINTAELPGQSWRISKLPDIQEASSRSENASKVFRFSRKNHNYPSTNCNRFSRSANFSEVSKSSRENQSHPKINDHRFSRSANASEVSSRPPKGNQSQPKANIQTHSFRRSANAPKVLLRSKQSPSQPKTNVHRVGRQEVCEEWNQFRRTQGMCERTDGTKDQRTFARVLYKRF